MTEHANPLPPPMKLLYEPDAPLEPLLDRTVAVLGFGAQGHAHALNLRDSGVRVIVANRRDSATGRHAIDSGFEPTSIPDAVARADLILFALPDEAQARVYDEQVAPHLRAGQALGWIHGFNVHFRWIAPRADVDVIMVAPKAQGHLLRSEFARGGGAACLIAVHQDATGRAREIALAWARGIGGARGGIIETTFKDECETDLFGEQAVLCGGLSALIKAGFETLVDAGYPPEIAYFECVHEVKLIVDLIYRGGLSYMRHVISSTARFGDLTRGPRLINDETRAEMRRILAEITSGQFAREWRAESERGLARLRALELADRDHPVELVGRQLRKRMPWLDPREPPPR